MDEVREWFSQSQYDLGSAEAMFDSGRYIYAVFMCHLAVEKALEGLVVWRTGEAPPRTHNLMQLAGLAQPNLSPAHMKFIARLGAAGVSTRYPQELTKALKDYPADVVRRYVTETKEVVSWLRGQGWLTRGSSGRRWPAALRGTSFWRRSSASRQPDVHQREVWPMARAVRRVPVAVILLLAVLLSLSAAGCRTTPRFQGAREAAQIFWNAAVDGDTQTVAGLMAPGCDQTAEDVVIYYRGYRYSGSADIVSAEGYRDVDVFVLSGLATPDGYTTLQLLAMRLSDAGWRVVHVGEGYSENPGGS